MCAFVLVRRRQGIVLVVTALMALIVLAPVRSGGAQGTITIRDTTINALADYAACDADAGVDTCIETRVQVGPDKTGETMIVCLAITTTIGEDTSFEEGCADVSATFTIDLDELGTAALSATSVDLFKTVCTESKECDLVFSRTAALTVLWTATGDLVRVRETIGDPHGPCTLTDKIDGVIRGTSATITLNDQVFEGTGNLQLLESKTKRRTNCG